MKFARSLLLGVAAAGVMASIGSTAQAADLILPPVTVDPIYNSPLFDFEGFYVGVKGGVLTGSVYGSLGVVAGANFFLTDAFLAGVEVQGNLQFGDPHGMGYSGVALWDVVGLLRAGFLVSDSVLVYAAGGVGLASGEALGHYYASTDSRAFYTVGGGLEFAVTDSMTLRGEVMYVHDLNTPTTGNRHGVRATIGANFYF